MSTADELLKYKQLLDSGLITQDEFNKAKEKIMEASQTFGDDLTKSEVDSVNQESTYNSNDNISTKVNDITSTDQNNNEQLPKSNDENKTMVFTTICIILLWPVGLIYTLIKKPFKKNTNLVLCIWYGFMTCMLILGVVLGIKYGAMKKNADSKQASIEAEQEKKQACDVNKFANISASELKEMLGEPNNTEQGTRSDFIEIPVVHYEYTNNETFGDITFELLNDKVIDFSATGNFTYDVDSNVLRELGVLREDTCAVVTKSDTEERYRCPSQTIDDLWVSGMDTANGTFKYLKVTYDMKYFEEWYIPMSTEEVSKFQNTTQDNVKSIMKSAETAVFPDTAEWSFGKNDYYVAVQAYVNSKNDAGELVKSEFTFIYKADTQELVYATYDGKPITENDYVDTQEIIIKQLAGGSDSATVDSSATDGTAADSTDSTLVNTTDNTSNN